jgi:hypothetical protein
MEAVHGSHRVGVLKNIRREERGFLQRINLNWELIDF